MIFRDLPPRRTTKPTRFAGWLLLACLSGGGSLRAEDQVLSPRARVEEPDRLALPAPAERPTKVAKKVGVGETALNKEAQGLLNLGASLTERGDYGAAEIAYRQLLNSAAPPESVKSGLLGLARMHRKQGSPTKAAAIYERFLENYPADERVPDALLDLGRTLRDMGAYKLAIARFYAVINSTLKLPSNDGFEHYQLLAKTAQFEVAETHFQTGQFAEANKFFSRLRMLDLAPADRARAQFKAGYSLQLSGDLDGAITSLKSYIEQWPDDENVPEARYLLATSLRATKHAQESLTATLDLLRAERSRSEADTKRWVYWQRRTGNQLANDFFQGGDILNALAVYHALAALTEDASWRIPATYQIGLCYERLGDVDRACKTYRSIVENAGTNPSPEVADTARMASSRLAHVDWKDATERQISMLFETTTGQTPPPAPKPIPNHDAIRSPSPTPAAL
jgi:TolA-binding protein